MLRDGGRGWCVELEGWRKERREGGGKEGRREGGREGGRMRGGTADLECELGVRSSDAVVARGHPFQ
eukprot:3899488-Rhodomonas_salina.1